MKQIGLHKNYVQLEDYLKCWSLKPASVNVCIIVKRRFFSERKSFLDRGVNSVKTKIAFDSDREYDLINAFAGG